MNIGDITKAVFQGVGKDETEDPRFTLLKVKNIKSNNQIDLEDVEFVKDVPLGKTLCSGDIISPFIGEAVRQCKFSVFEKPRVNETDYTVDNNTGVIRPNDAQVDSAYLATILNTSIGKIQLEQLIGGGGVPFLGAANAEKIKIPLPPLLIQRAIAKTVSNKRGDLLELQRNAEATIDDARKQVEQMIFA